MKRRLLSLCLLATAAVAGVPTLDSLAADWLPVVPGRDSHPVCTNTHGAGTLGPAFGAVSALTFPPFSQGGDSGGVRVDGLPLAPQATRWLPYEAQQRAAHGGLEFECVARLAAEAEGVLLRLTLHNPTAGPLTVRLAWPARGAWACCPGHWEWSVPRPRPEAPGRWAVEPGAVTVWRDTGSPAAVAVTGVVDEQSLTVEPGQRLRLERVLAVAADATAATAAARGWARDEAAFDAARAAWEQRWQAAFTPGNGRYSGWWPTLTTADERVARVYYMALLTALQTERTNLPGNPRCFVTAGPNYATTLMYFWDTAMWPTLWALLDPATVRLHLRDWLAMDPHRCYARDYLGQRGAGPWYSANDYSLVQCLDAYLAVTGDRALLGETAAGKTVLEHLDGFAAHWRTLVRPGSPLADYGGAENLLECVPTYVHAVPSLNAANVWMLRRVARYRELAGDVARAVELRASADALLPAVLELYLPGQGVWCSRHRDGQRVEMRHVYDFATIGATLDADLPPATRSEMVSFVQRELLTDTWMRAQSLADPAAAQSDRPDHGPRGAYDGWPAQTAAAMTRLGAWDAALDLLHRVESVTHASCFAQSHELVAPAVTPACAVAATRTPAAGPLSVAAWVRPAAWAPRYWGGSLLSTDSWGDGDRGWVLRCGGAGQLSLAVALDGRFREVLSPPNTLRLGVWQAVGGGYDGRRLTLTVDGREVASTPATGTLSVPALPLRLGGHGQDPGRAFVGELAGALVGGAAPGTITLQGGAVWLDSEHGCALQLPAAAPPPATLQAVIAHRGGQDTLEGCGAAFAETLLRQFFGCQPAPDGRLELFSPRTPRPLAGRLTDVRVGGARYDLTAGPEGVQATQHSTVGP